MKLKGRRELLLEMTVAIAVGAMTGAEATMVGGEEATLADLVVEIGVVIEAAEAAATETTGTPPAKDMEAAAPTSAAKDRTRAGDDSKELILNTI